MSKGKEQQASPAQAAVKKEKSKKKSLKVYFFIKKVNLKVVLCD